MPRRSAEGGEEEEAADDDAPAAYGARLSGCARCVCRSVWRLVEVVRSVGVYSSSAVYSQLNDPNLVCNVECIVVRGKADVRLLLPVWPDKSVDVRALNVVHGLHCCLDLPLVGELVDDEHERVVVLNLLHGALRRQRELNHTELVHLHENRGRGDLRCGAVGALIMGVDLLVPLKLRCGACHVTRLAQQLLRRRLVEVRLRSYPNHHLPPLRALRDLPHHIRKRKRVESVDRERKEEDEEA